MYEEKDKEQLEMERAEYLFHRKQRNQVLWFWYISLLLFALLGPCFDVPTIYPLAGLAGVAAFISMLVLISMKMWKHLVIGLLLFFPIAVATDVYDKQNGIVKQTSDDQN